MLAVLNIGSSSAKFALFADPDSVLARGQVFPDPRHAALQCQINRQNESAQWESPNQQWQNGFFRWAEQRFPANPVRAVAHRIVHGGQHLRAPVILNSQTLSVLDSIAPLAPLHVPPALRVVRRIAQLRPQLPQVGCFDTAFHASIPPARRRLPIPREFADMGIARYGFHGLSYQNIADQAPDLLGEKTANGKIIALHLGNGASGCAMLNRRSQNTTMGLTALDGLVMGTRCGALDPGAILHLIRARGMTPQQVEEILTRKSGLLGLSGISADMRKLRSSDSPDAQFAVQAFCESAARHAAALACDIGGMDALIFTGGIGENNPDIRADICARLQFLGVRLNPELNHADNPDSIIISAPESDVVAAVIPADEERVMARGAFELL